MKRRASLSISTNAIVVLIVAVIMLGLIIGFIQSTFNDVRNKLLPSLDDEPEPEFASPAKPITLSSPGKFSSRGDTVGFKVRILNTGTSTSQNVRPYVDCTRDGAIGTVDRGNTYAYDGNGDGVWDNPTTVTVVNPHPDDEAFPATLDVNRQEMYEYFFRISDDAPGGEYLCRIQAWGQISVDPDGTGPSPAYDVQVAPLNIRGAQFKLTITD